MKYKRYNTDTLMTNSGSVILNSNNAGMLKVGFMSDAYLSGEGSLINLQFSLDKSGVTTPYFTKFLMNSTKTDSITKGSIEIIAYGDVDNNQEVQSYDASLALVKSVGLNPLPNEDPTPWKALRANVADVDGNHSITAYDAGLILKKSVDLIEKFPVETSPSLVAAKSRVVASENADVMVSEENNQLVFRSFGDFVGMNLVVTGNIASLDKPVISSSVIPAKNINDDIYNVGLAITTPPAKGSIIMRIPVKSEMSGEVTLTMTINNQVKVVTISKTITGIETESEKSVGLYLNPLTIELSVNHPELYRLIEIISTDGRKVYAGAIPEDGFIIANKLQKAVYLVKLTHKSGNRTVGKIIKR